MKKPDQTYLSDNQLAARFGMSRNSVWRHVREGRLPAPIKLFEKTTRWKLSEIEEFEAGRIAVSRAGGGE